MSQSRSKDHSGLKLGIGVATFNRVDLLTRTLDAIIRHTSTPYHLIVADDGSSDGTLALLRSRHIPHVAGPNRGIAWNKNRILFHLHEVARCDVILLLEDDIMPRHDGWELPWIEATRKWGHANIGGNWFEHLLGSEAGTPDDPILSTILTAQCSGFSRVALNAVGYMDTRFGRYGHEHCEHSERMIRAGFGGTRDPQRFFLLRSDLQLNATKESDYHSELGTNSAVYAMVSKDPTLYRKPWRTRSEKKQIQSDLKNTNLYEFRSKFNLLKFRTKFALIK